MCDAVTVRALDDGGKQLDAEYDVETDGRHLALIMESRSGVSGSRSARNPDYNRALTVLLSRLGTMNALLADALVDSRQVHEMGLPEEDRRIIRAPVMLASQGDMDGLRRRMGAVQALIGQSPDATKGGNATKRIRLRLEVPGFGPAEAPRLAEALATVWPLPKPGPRVWPEAGEVLLSLIGEEIRTATGAPNMVLAVQDRTALVSTSRSPQGQPVEISDVQHGMDKLRAQGSIRVSVEELGHRSAFVAAVLATLPGVQMTASPAIVTLTPIDAAAYSDPEFAVLDGTASVRVRREQAQLRSILADGRELAGCALCGHQYPLRFLVAAHIKKRSICTDDERRDLRHVAMLACTFGCDALYEAGWITVGPDGCIKAITPDAAPAGRLRDHLQQLAHRHCHAHSQASEPYFAWHRATIFRGDG